MTPDQIELLTGLGGAAVSPDGRTVAVVVRRIDPKANRSVSQIWLHDVDRGTLRRLTDGVSDGDPVWSPDGERLAFASDRGTAPATSTLHVLPVSGGGELLTIAARDEGIGEIAWSPDGRMLAFTSRVRDARYEPDEEHRRPPRRITRFFSRLNGEGWVSDRPAHVHVVDAEGFRPPRDLTPGEWSFGSPAWLADSSGVVVSGAAHETWDLDFAQDLYLVPLVGEHRCLTGQSGIYGQPVAHLDGRRVAFRGFDDTRMYPQNSRIGVLDLETGERRWVSTDLDRTFELTGGPGGLVWDGDDLLAVAEDRGDARIHRIAGDGSTAPRPITPADACVKQFHMAGGTLAMCTSTATRPDELHVGAMSDDEDPRRVSDFSQALLDAAPAIPADQFCAATADGHELDVWVYAPPEREPGRRYPVLLNVHGGPHTQYGNTFFDEAQMQARAGFVVVMTNPRGSSGREEAWGQAILGPRHPVRAGTGYGSVDADDVLCALDAALDRYDFCDPDRVGMLGGSYGGYMATWLASHSDRFRAICSERAVNNLLSLEWNSDIATLFQIEHGPRHIDDEEEYRRMSPITYVRDIHTPLLIVHSEDDLRCPISQAEELFVAMRLLGKEVEFVRFPAENHELSRSGSPVHRRQRAEILLDWFRRHLGEGATPVS